MSYIIDRFFTVEVQVASANGHKENDLKNTHLVGAGVVSGAGGVGLAGVVEGEDALFAVLGPARRRQVECFNIGIFLVSELDGSFLYLGFK